MDTAAHLGMLVSCLLAVAVGLRLLKVWLRTRCVPELAIGVNVLSVALGAALLEALGVLGSSGGKQVPVVPPAIGLSGLAVHVVALFVGTWKIFRPDERWPRPVVALLSLVAAW